MRISKFWVYLPIYLIIWGGAVWALYLFLNSEATPEKPVAVVEQPQAPVDEIPAAFLACFNTNKKLLEGIFRITPSEIFMPLFKTIDKSCYDNICAKLQEVANKEIDNSEFYNFAKQDQTCFSPLLEKAIDYHFNELNDVYTLTLFYNSGQYQLSADQEKSLDILFRIFRQNAENSGLLIIGRASKSGNKDQNKLLSKRRAESIVTFMSNRGINDLKNDFIYFGSEPPQLDIERAGDLSIERTDYRNIRFGAGLDDDYSMRLNQSVMLIIYPRNTDPFDLEG